MAAPVLEPSQRAPGLLLGPDVTLPEDVELGAYVVIHAGTVIGGSQLRKTPHIPRRRRRVRFGSRSANLSNNSEGSAQSRPMTATLVARGFGIIHSSSL